MLYPDMNLQKRTQQNTTRYRTALYLRLSREDGDKTESDSIANQRTLLEAYAADHPELCIVDEFVDDGYSGSNFERPAFQNLFRELEQGTINCILVKDLSRFGRNYIEVGRYLERIFPVMRVRLIAVTDNYDSQSAWKTSDSIMVPMRNLLNDAYCRRGHAPGKSGLEFGCGAPGVGAHRIGTGRKDGTSTAGEDCQKCHK